MVEDNHKIAVWFSCGAASAVAAKLTLEQYPNCKVNILNSPIAEEDEDNRRFLLDVQDWLGQKIEIVASDKYKNQSAVDVWKHKKFMSSIHGAPCTVELKKRPRQIWEQNNKVDWHVLGFTWEEKSRHERFVLTERDNVIPVLINNKLNKTDCMRIISEAGIKLPRVYKLGFPNANCVGCVKATSPTYWNLVRSTFPETFDERAKQSRDIGVKLVRVKNERIFLDELDPNAKGNKLKSNFNECGLFCEEE